MNLAYSLAHMMGGIMLLCAFSFLSQRRLAAMITIYQIEALSLAAAAFGQGFAQSAVDLYLTGLITLVINAILLPLGLRRIARRLDLMRTVETALPIGLSMILGFGLIGVVVLAVLPVTVNTTFPTREDLAISLSVMLLGFLIISLQRHALAQVIGFLSAANGLVLAATGMPGMPFVPELSVALLVFLALLAAGVFQLSTCESFGLLGGTSIEDIERRGR